MRQIAKKAKVYYEFGRFRVNPAEGLLYCDDQVVQLKPKVFDTLRVFLERQGHVLSKEELLQAIWPDSFVEENNLAQNISTLRKALGQQYIETIPKRGYRFVGEVKEVWVEPATLVVKEHARATISIEEEEDGPEERASAVPTVEALAVRTNVSPAATSLLAKITRRKTLIAIVTGTVAVTLLGVGVGWRSLTKSPAAGRFQSSQSLPNTENSWRVALSPDGEYMVHAVKTRSANVPDEESLWLRQVATASDVQLVAPARAHYLHLAFAPDGRHVYYSVKDQAQAGDQAASLYKIPALGGAAVKLVSDTDGFFTLAPDGQRLAFVRSSREENRLLLAQSDGGAEQVLAARRRPNAFSHLAWSPNGEVIAAAATDVDAGGKRVEVVEVKVSDGAERFLTAMKWRDINGLAWLPDGSAVMVARFWLWRIAYPSGAIERIPGDNNYYWEVSLSADGSALASIASTLTGSIWVIANGDFENARPITNVTRPNVPRWMPDGGIVFVSSRSGNVEIWAMRVDGTGLKQLTVDEALDTDPVSSPDGRYVVFTSDRSGTTNIWRMDSDGGNPRQLTTGKFDSRPEISPDGKWVVYTATEVEEMSLWKVPIEGGTAVQLARESRVRPAISPDGKLIACGYGNQQSNAEAKVALIPFEGGEPIRVLDLPGSANSILRWTPDGRHLSYLNMLDGGSNLWLYALDGGPPKQITHFKDHRVNGFDWSRDGKNLLCSRSINISKVVLLKDAR
jgi:Tol biopolymer transport system component/DNA-binding winged helix-turn-helix (wHTH) protein